MNIISTGIVDRASDVFWDDISDIAKDAAERPTLVLVRTYTPGSQEEPQLQKMLAVCGLQPEQYNIIEIAEGQKVSWHRLREQLNPKVIFLIGVMPDQLGISALFQAHMPNNFNDRVWLPTLSLSELEQQPAVKKQLWLSGMKPIFVDKESHKS